MHACDPVPIVMGLHWVAGALLIILEICYTNPVTVTQITGNFSTGRYFFFLCSLCNRTQNELIKEISWENVAVQITLKVPMK